MTHLGAAEWGKILTVWAILWVVVATLCRYFTGKEEQ